MIPAELLAAYRTTRYVVDDSPIGSFTLRIDAPAPIANRLCEMFGKQSWVYITACNPRSQALSPQENAARMAQLEAALRAHQLPFFAGKGIGEDPNWIPEPSLFVIGADRELSLKLGRRFEQFAVVYGELGGTAQLLEISKSP